ncbi:GNAT family N-acetyltransferase [Paenibacillus thermotolerans]|uniref:GNAT family N-acetyltransferase n=1 Tax=Paenibacillus thermotolerans TaxID=3027807 RepID=UPI002367E7D4|nr:MULTISPECIES: GNAT family N-acetyltransferase [unclassified Paenibacillus]
MTFTYCPFDITDPQHARNVQELQQLSYPIEAQLIGLETLPPLLDTVETLMGCGEQFIGCFEGDRLIGAVAYKMDGGTIDIHRMMVHPERFRKGIANTLLTAALSVPGVNKAVVSTGSANLPAVTLYERHGFKEKERVEVAPGVTITLFEKPMVL